MPQNDDRELYFIAALPRDEKAMRHLARDAYRMYVDRMCREPAPMTSDTNAVMFENLATS